MLNILAAVPRLSVSPQSICQKLASLFALAQTPEAKTFAKNLTLDADCKRRASGSAPRRRWPCRPLELCRRRGRALSGLPDAAWSAPPLPGTDQMCFVP